MSGGVFFTHLLFLIPANLCSSKKYCFLRINPATDKVCSLPHLRHSVGIPLSPYADSRVTRNASASTVFKTVCQFTDIPPLFFSLLSRRCNSGERRFRTATLCKRPRNHVAIIAIHAITQDSMPCAYPVCYLNGKQNHTILSGTLPAYVKAALCATCKLQPPSTAVHATHHYNRNSQGRAM